MDDCLIFSKTFQEHLGHVKAVLQRLRDARIQLRSEKCHFAYAEVDFLGHHITPEGRIPGRSSVELLLHFPRPNSVKELQSFLGSVNFYRAYIPRIAQIAHPLYGNAESVLRLSSESVLRLFRVRNLSYDYFEFGICPTPEFGICPTIIPSFPVGFVGFSVGLCGFFFGFLVFFLWVFVGFCGYFH